MDLQKRIKEYEALQKEILRLSQENEDLKTRMAAKSESESEISSLKETISKLETEKEAALLQSKESSERLTNMTAQISHTQEEFDKLKEEMQFRVQGLSSAQERCDELERTTQNLSSELERMKERKRECEGELKKEGERNQSLSFELERMKQRQRESEEELKLELERLNVSLQETQLQKMKAEIGKMSLEKALDESEERIRVLSEEREMLGETERKNLDLMLELERMKQRQRENEEELSKQNQKFERLDVYLHEVQLQKVEAERAKVEWEREMERIKGENLTLCSNLKEREIELTEKRVELERLNASLQDAQVRAEMERIELEREMERMREEHANLCSNLKERERKLSEKIGRLEKISVNLQETHLESEKTAPLLETPESEGELVQPEKTEPKSVAETDSQLNLPGTEAESVVEAELKHPAAEPIEANAEPNQEQLEDPNKAHAEGSGSADNINMMTMRRIMKERLCLNCWASDHQVEKCVKGRKCFKCGEVGHMLNSCPKK